MSLAGYIVADISVAYQIPSSEPFDLVKANKATAGRFNYPQWEYWNFFTSKDASQLQEADLSRMYQVNHGLYPSNVPEENGRVSSNGGVYRWIPQTLMVKHRTSGCARCFAPLVP